MNSLDVIAHVPGADQAASRAEHVVLVALRPGHNSKRHEAGNINNPDRIAIRLDALPEGTTHILLERK